MPNENRVLIAGAGPVGYTAALNLAHYRIPFTLIEAEDRKTGLVADFDLSVLADDTPYPYCLMLEQHKLSKIIDIVLKEKYQEQ